MMLDSRIAEERMIALDPPYREPDWYWSLLSDHSSVPHAITMDATGVVAPRWVLLDEVDWSRTVAVRVEDRWGNSIDTEICEDELDGWE